MIVWIRREKISKEDGHVIYIDLYQDTDTKVQYFGTKDNLIPRLNTDGTPFIAPSV